MFDNLYSDRFGHRMVKGDSVLYHEGSHLGFGDIVDFSHDHGLLMIQVQPEGGGHEVLVEQPDVMWMEKNYFTHYKLNCVYAKAEPDDDS